MSEYLTYAGIQTTDLDRVLEKCTAAAKSLGCRFEVPSAPTNEAHTWIGVFQNGWIFAQADPAVWELLDIFGRVSREMKVPLMSGSTDGDFRKWSYEYAEGGDVAHAFYADPSLRFEENEYADYQGDPGALARIFNVSRIRLVRQMRQFDAVGVQEFLETLGFDVRNASNMRFVIVGPGQHTGPSTLSVVVQRDKVADSQVFAKSAGATTQAFGAVRKALREGYGSAAALKAQRYGAEFDIMAAQDLFLRLRQDNPEVALSVADELVKRVNAGEFARLPSPKRELQEASLFGLRGLALHDLGRFEEAAFELKHRALNVNRYMGPQHRASIASTLGDTLVQLARYEEALDPLRLCLAERPLNAPTWANLARAAFMSGRQREARQAVLFGIATRRDMPVWRELMPRLGLTERDLLPERNPAQMRIFRRDAQNLVREGRRLEAIEQFRLSQHHAPDDIDATWGLACAIAEAIRDNLMPVNPDDHEVTRLLEQVCFGNPSWPWSWGTLIDVLERRGEHRRAVQACEAYGLVHTTRTEDLQGVAEWLAKARPEIGVIMLRILVDRFVTLRVQSFGSDADRDSAQARARAALGWALLETNRPQEAVDHLIEAGRLNPNNVDTWGYLADAHYRLGNASGAQRALHRGLRIDPEHPRLKRLAERMRNGRYY